MPSTAVGEIRPPCDLLPEPHDRALHPAQPEERLLPRHARHDPLRGEFHVVWVLQAAPCSVDAHGSEEDQAVPGSPLGRQDAVEALPVVEQRLAGLWLGHLAQVRAVLVRVDPRGAVVQVEPIERPEALEDFARERQRLLNRVFGEPLRNCE